MHLKAGRPFLVFVIVDIFSGLLNFLEALEDLILLLPGRTILNNLWPKTFSLLHKPSVFKKRRLCMCPHVWKMCKRERKKETPVCLDTAGKAVFSCAFPCSLLSAFAPSPSDVFLFFSLSENSPEILPYYVTKGKLRLKLRETTVSSDTSLGWLVRVRCILGCL